MLYINYLKMQNLDEIEKQGELVRKLKSQNAGNETDALVDDIVFIMKDRKELQEFAVKIREEYKELYRQHHNIPRDALVEWRF